MLAYRNYAEKVINLGELFSGFGNSFKNVLFFQGRVDVPPELIDSVISTIGSNFSNLKSLHLRLQNFDIDVATPANLLFDNLTDLNLQFVSGNVDKPFKKFIQLGWSSVKCLTIQYASITEESVRAIGDNMPQLRKLVLHAIEFRCDHLARRYWFRFRESFPWLNLSFSTHPGTATGYAPIVRTLFGRTLPICPIWRISNFIVPSLTRKYARPLAVWDDSPIWSSTTAPM